MTVGELKAILNDASDNNETYISVRDSLYGITGTTVDDDGDVVLWSSEMEEDE